MKDAKLVYECLYWDTYTNTTTSHLCFFNEVTIADEKPTAQIRQGNGRYYFLAHRRRNGGMLSCYHLSSWSGLLCRRQNWMPSHETSSFPDLNEYAYIFYRGSANALRPIGRLLTAARFVRVNANKDLLYHSGRR